MAERYTFSVAYEPATLRSAVRSHLLRSPFAPEQRVLTILTLAIAGLSLALPLVFHRDWATGLRSFALLLVFIAIAVGWIYLKGATTKLARVKTPRADFVISDAAVEVTTDQGSGRFGWDAIQQIWKFKRYWLLMIDASRFVTLPLADAPAEALQFLDKKIQPRPFRAA